MLEKWQKERTKYSSNNLNIYLYINLSINIMIGRVLSCTENDFPPRQQCLYQLIYSRSSQRSCLLVSLPFPLPLLPLLPTIIMPSTTEHWTESSTCQQIFQYHFRDTLFSVVSNFLKINDLSIQVSLILRHKSIMQKQYHLISSHLNAI